MGKSQRVLYVQTWRLVGALCVMAFLGGCGGGLNNVEGTVVWKDGSPAKELEGSQVVFESAEKKTEARGVIQGDGTFRLTTTKPDDGALAGDYSVAIIEARKAQGGPDSSAIAPGLLPSRYYDLKTSGLKETVKSGTNKITLTVERAAGGGK